MKYKNQWRRNERVYWMPSNLWKRNLRLKKWIAYYQLLIVMKTIIELK